MLSDKVRADLDQATAVVAETMPPMWRRIYLRCIEEGFSEDQALLLVRTYIAAFGFGGVKL